MTRDWPRGIHNRFVCRPRHRTALCLVAALLMSPPGWSEETGSETPGEDTSPAEPTANDCGAFPFLDWTSEVDQEGRTAQRSQRCRGSYRDPLAGVDTSKDPSTQEIEATAERSELEGDMVRFFGGVEARQGYRVIRAAEAEYNRVTGTGSLLGEVEIREPGLLLRGATGSLDSNSGEARLTANQFVLHDQHLRGGADLVVRRGDGIIELDDGYYSYCPPLNNGWVLQAKDIELDIEEGVGVARDAKIELGGTPVVYTPYLRFPLDDRRKSGFLFPEITDDSNGGLDLATPYYFNLAPNYDATLTPRYIMDRGLLTELELRHLSAQAGYWELGGAWISGDDQYQDDVPGEDGDRWLSAIEQTGEFKERWRTNIDFTKTSDDEYFNDIGTTSLQLKQSTHLLQAGQVDYLGDSWQTTLRFEEFQTIARDVERDQYSKLPQLNLRRTATSQDFTPNLLLQSDYAYFDHNDEPTGHRLYNEVGGNFPMRWIWGFLTPTAKYRQLNYDLDEDVFFDGAPDDTPDVGAPMFSLDGGLFFERSTAWGLQTLEPRVYYLWSDFEEQEGLPSFDTTELTFTYNQLFRETRFSGNDRIDDSNQVSVGLTTRFIDQDSGREKLAASIGQIYYFDDRLVSVGAIGPEDTEGSSAIAAEFAISPTEQWEFRSAWLWNTDENEIDQSTFQAGWRGDGGAIVNLGYSYRRNRTTANDGLDIDQLDFSTYYPFSKEWRIFLRSLYDLEENERVNDMAGIEYNSCCWRVRLVYQRYIDQNTNRAAQDLVEYENATYIEFQLKGLGGIGTRVSELLEEFIRGYEDSDL
ncbi:MAG: LPS-assembly protein LptD [Halieaceae bacterium]|nr:LPS-assembly protein LptD [Halieaceae bacterium]